MFVETSSHTPFAIRRIEELNKTSSGNVEAKVMCFYRRRDLPNPLVQLADKHQSEYGLWVTTVSFFSGWVLVGFFGFITGVGAEKIGRNYIFFND